MTNHAPSATPAGDLRPGDVLLMRGRGQISSLIAWCGDSIYSHAAVMVDGGDFVEGVGGGARRLPLARRLADAGEVIFVDAFRPLANDLSALDDADRALVAAKATSLVGTAYPLDQLVTLGVMVAVRGKLPRHPVARIVVREALDHLVHDDPRRMVCSELVYRSFADCAAKPAGRLAPRIVPEPRGTEPFPDIDWKALWEEVRPIVHPARRPVLEAGVATAGRTVACAEPMALAEVSMDDGELHDRLEAARGVLGMEPLAGSRYEMAMATAATGIPRPAPAPNPRLVTPLDLASTPSHIVLGRLVDYSSSPQPLPA